MKQCSSCKNLVQQSLTLCPHCGHDFDSEEDDAKRTMMGIPGVDVGALRSKKERDEQNVGRSTMFGLPIQSATQEEEDHGSTQVVGSDLASAFSLPNQDGPSLHIAQDQQFDVRSTSPGGFPSVQRGSEEESEVATGRPGSAWGLGEESSSEPEQATVVASANLFEQHAAQEEAGEDVGYAQFKGPVHSSPRKHETLMGMNLDDLTASARQTMFSMPSPMASGLSEASEEEEGNDSPTQAMGGEFITAALGQEEHPEESNRKRLLEKLRNNSQSPALAQADGERSRATMFGIPSVNVGDEATVAEDSPLSPERDSSQAPNTGVLKMRRKTDPEGLERAPSSAILGSSSYNMVNPEVSSEPVKSTVMGVRFEIPQPDEAIEPGYAPEGLGSDDTIASDEPFERTRVASGEVAQAQLAHMQKLQKQEAEQDELRTQVVEADDILGGDFDFGQPDPPMEMTREQSLSDIKAKLRDSLAKKSEVTEDAQPGHEDVTRQHSTEELGGLFTKAPRLDAPRPPTAAAPRFNIPSSPSALSSPEPPQEELTLDILDEVPVFALGEESEVEQAPSYSAPQPSPASSPAIQVASAPQHTPHHTPMLQEQPGRVEAETISPEPFYATGGHASPQGAPTPQPPQQQPQPYASPQPQHYTGPQPQQPQPHAPMQPQQGQLQRAKPKQPGRVFQVAFGVLGALAFLGSSAVSLVSAGALPAAPLGMVVVLAPVALGVLALVGAILPGGGLRAGVLALAGLLGFAIFGLGAVSLSGLGVGVGGLIVVLVGGLLCLAAAGFPTIAKAIP